MAESTPPRGLDAAEALVGLRHIHTPEANAGKCSGGRRINVSQPLQVPAATAKPIAPVVATTTTGEVIDLAIPSNDAFAGGRVCLAYQAQANTDSIFIENQSISGRVLNIITAWRCVVPDVRGHG